MSHRVEMKYRVDRKRRRNICSMDDCTSRVQRNSLCAKHCRTFHRSMEKETFEEKSHLKRWSPSTFTNDHSNLDVHRIEKIFSTLQHHLEQELPDESLISSRHIDDDEVKSESSIEYDYTNPSTVNETIDRHVSIATIWLQDQQWRQLELFIKHFSSSASLSNNLNVNNSTTHLLVDDSSTPLQCTFSKKIFQAVARRIFVVSIRWIDECLRQNAIVDEIPFEIHGDSTVNTMHLVRRSSSQSLFSSSICFAIECSSFQRILTREELAELVVLTGASLVQFDRLISMKNFLLLVLVDPTADRRQLEKKYKQFHQRVHFLTAGFLLKSIVYHKQQPFEDFQI